MMTPEYILMDGSAFLFRAYFAHLRQRLSNEDGFPTGAMFGVLNAIKMYQRRYPEAKMRVIFDAKGKTFRHQLFAEYKANRKKMDDDLQVQIQPLLAIIKALGLPLIVVDNVEADDVIATLAKRYEQKQKIVFIASSDKDLHQLITDNVYQLDMKDKLMDKTAVFDKFGVTPAQFLDFLSLTGDTADNIAGIPSVGAKTAAKWLQQYGDLKNLLKNAEAIKGSVGEKLRNNLSMLTLSKKLVSLKSDVVIDETLLKTKKADTKALIKFYQNYGFSTWLKQLDSNNTSTQVSNKSDEKKPITTTKTLASLDDWQQKRITTIEQLNDLISEIKAEKSFVFDTETTALSHLDAKLVAFVFGVKKCAYYLPVGHQYLGVCPQLPTKQVCQALRAIFADKHIKKMGQNLKYDSHILANYNLVLNGIDDDTMLASYCLNSVATRHNLDDLAKHYLNYKTIQYKELTGSGKKQIGFEQVHIDQAQPYACEDVIVTQELAKVLTPLLKKQPLLTKLYQQLELPLIKVLLTIERNGVKLNPAILAKQQTQMMAEIKQLEKQAFDIAGEVFNLDSPKQVQAILFGADKLNLDAVKKTPGGQASTDEESLSMLDHPLATIMLKHRTLTKLCNTYLIALPKQINAKTKRLHTNYHQTGTITGRLSSSQPNLQNIPIRSSEGRQIRQAFVAERGNVIIAADYSQIELRIMAHLSQDKSLLSAFSNHLDIHKQTASDMFGVALEKVSRDQRRHAKAINFGLMYGMSAFGLGKQINAPRSQAQHYMDLYFQKYPSVQTYISKIQQQAKENGFVETILGRRLYLPDINAKNKMRQKHALRTAINAPMQGSAADIIKQAMLAIDQWIKDEKPSLKMTMQVHDELVFEADKKQAENYVKIITERMTTSTKISVPLLVDVGIGDNWQQAHQ